MELFLFLHYSIKNVFKKETKVAPYTKERGEKHQTEGGTRIGIVTFYTDSDWLFDLVG